MEKQTNPKLVISIAVLVFSCVIVWQKALHAPTEKNQLARIAEALETASSHQDKFAAADQFEKLTALKYKYQDEKNIPCLEAVMSLSTAADEVNATGSWSNKEDSISTIKQCKG